jgi:hypothetical protein
MMSQTLATLDFDIQRSAEHLSLRVSTLLDAIGEANGGRILDASKNLLETVFRTMVTDKNGEVQEGRRAATFPGLYEQAKGCILLSEEPEILDKITELCDKAILVIGQLRNSYGFSSHGRDGYAVEQIGLPEALFVARVALGITNLFYGRHIESPLSHMNARVRYEDHETFNEYFDSINGEDITVGGIVVRPSEVLFNADEIAYREYLIEYMSQLPDIGQGDEL